jgi:hypothetical protein
MTDARHKVKELSVRPGQALLTAIAKARDQGRDAGPEVRVRLIEALVPQRHVPVAEATEVVHAPQNQSAISRLLSDPEVQKKVVLTALDLAPVVAAAVG